MIYWDNFIKDYFGFIPIKLNEISYNDDLSNFALILAPNVVSLSEDRRTQVRISVESKTTVFDPREKGHLRDKFISLLFNVRQFPRAGEKFEAIKEFNNLCKLCENLLSEKIVPNIVQPLISTIAQKRFI